MTKSDRMRELLLRYQNADPNAFDELYHLVAEPLYRFLCGRCRNAREAEDALQETFLRIHKYILSYRPELSGYAWIIAIAQNVFLRGHVGKEVLNEALSDDIPSPAPDAERTVIAAELVSHLFNDLSEVDRRLVIGRLVEEEEYEQIAKDLDVKENTLRQRFSRLTRRWTGKV